MSNLQEKIAIVTGAARGIGLAIAERLAKDGASVVIADIDESEAKKQAEKLKNSIAVQVNGANEKSVKQMVETVLNNFGRIDILVNNAGITGYAKPVIEYETEEWRRVISLNLDGVFYCSKAVLPTMTTQNYGRIVNIASISGKEGNPNMAAYSTSKAGVIGFTKALGKELATSGILVNCITPAVIETALLEKLTAEAVNYMVSKIPMGRVGRPAEVAALVAWLCSDECSFTTGGVFDLSGGRATY